MTYLNEMDAETGLMPASTDRKKGAELHERYQQSQPFPHISIDDFLPSEVLERCLAEFPRRADDTMIFDREQERNKAQFNPDEMSLWLRTMFYGFNSRPFLRILENITGIKNLIPDPYFLGAGFHEIGEGGHLSVHADFNHHKPMDLERRINVLIYLNKDWKLEYGGALELWSEGMASCERRIEPAFNRCVIFNTTSESWHGNPEPVRHPQLVSRRSIALYYYTATWSGAKRDHTTQFKVRPGTQDRPDWKVRLRESALDFIPPILARSLRKDRG